LNVLFSHYCNHLEEEKKLGLRITRTGQFTVIHHQKRRRDTNDKDKEKEGEKRDV
jgi:hypothetical protein